jgi:hypothetical protein
MGRPGVGRPGAGAMKLHPYMADAQRCHRRTVDARELSPKVGGVVAGPPHRASLRRHCGAI